MEKKKFFPLNLTKSTKELQQLIAEHPDYPIVDLAGYAACAAEISTEVRNGRQIATR